MASTNRVVFLYKYPNNSSLQLRIVEQKTDGDPDVHHVLELSDEVDAMGERRWRPPDANEHEINANRLTTLLALTIEAQKGKGR